MEMNMWKVRKIAHQRDHDGWDFIDVYINTEYMKKQKRVMIALDAIYESDEDNNINDEVAGDVWR